MKGSILRTVLSDYVVKVRYHMTVVQESMTWLSENLPMEEDLKERSRMMCDNRGEVFLYFDGIYYSWEIITSILKEKDMITINDLY